MQRQEVKTLPHSVSLGTDEADSMAGEGGCVRQPWGAMPPCTRAKNYGKLTFWKSNQWFPTFSSVGPPFYHQNISHTSSHMIIFIFLLFVDWENTCWQKAITNCDFSNCFYFINCYLIVILLTNTGTKLEQTMLVIEPPGSQGLAGFSKWFPLLSNQGIPTLSCTV